MVVRRYGKVETSETHFHINTCADSSASLAGATPVLPLRSIDCS